MKAESQPEKKLKRTAKIKIDLDRSIGKIDKKLYGNFVEHLGRCVYGGIYDEASELSDERGFRKDVLEVVKALQVPIMRYPGGNFVSNYHWKDGVGPKSERPPRMELAWGRLESNRFGTNEFMEYAREIDTEPYFAVNLGTGTITEAQQWVEYCNVESGPFYAELRKKHGYANPWKIKYWSLGNEMDGFWQMGHLNAEDYAKKAGEAAKLMKLTDPEIQLVAAGASNYRPDADPNDWNAVILKELRDVVDYLALHMYVGNPNDNYYNYLATPLLLEQRTRIVKGMIDREMERANRGDRDPIYIAWDEYNSWYRARDQETMNGTRALEEKYNLEDALVIAGFLNAFVRNADCVKMANMAQLVNVIAPVFTSDDDLFLQTIYYPLQLFALNVHGTALDVYVKCENYSTDRFYVGLDESTTQQDAVPFLDVSASYHQGEVILNVVNRHLEDEITADIISQSGDFDGMLSIKEVNGASVKAQNDFGKTAVKTNNREAVVPNGEVCTYSFPPHSFTQIRARIKINQSK